jgi:glycosyltransferase involved in cell wall biosynthesis
MSSGLPVIATDVGGNKELVQDGASGSLVPANDPQALADQMARYARSPALRREHGETGCRRIAADFNMARMLSAYGSVYDQLMEKRSIAQ